MYNILICDDEKDIVSAIEIYLKTAGPGILYTKLITERKLLTW